MLLLLSQPQPWLTCALTYLCSHAGSKRSWKVAEELEYSMIGVNEVAITSELCPLVASSTLK